MCLMVRGRLNNNVSCELQPKCESRRTLAENPSCPIVRRPHGFPEHGWRAIAPRNGRFYPAVLEQSTILKTEQRVPSLVSLVSNETWSQASHRRRSTPGSTWPTIRVRWLPHFGQRRGALLGSDIGSW